MKKWKMPKQILSILLVISMMLAYMPILSEEMFTVYAAVDTTETGDCDGNHNGYEKIKFTDNITESGKYYCATKQSPSHTYLTVSGDIDVVICLNGKEVRSEGNRTNPMIIIKDGAKVTLCDCKGTGSISAPYGNCALISIYENSVLNMYGGTLKDTYKYQKGSAVTCNGTFNMYGGTITENNNGAVRIVLSVIVNSTFSF